MYIYIFKNMHAKACRFDVTECRGWARMVSNCSEYLVAWYPGSDGLPLLKFWI